MVRAELGPEDAATLVPLVNGGVAVHKIFGLMHDTCSTANRVAELMATLRDEQAMLPMFGKNPNKRPSVTTPKRFSPHAWSHLLKN
jgi:hypothetical protein